MSLHGEYEPSPNAGVRTQVEEYEASGGTRANTRHGLPVVILTSVGAKSGRLRKTPLMRVEHDGRYVAVASLGGAPKNPVWYHNLRNHQHVELQDGAVRQDMTARELVGEEREVWWQRAVDAFPNYAEYQTKTDREIPLFLLEPWAD